MRSGSVSRGVLPVSVVVLLLILSVAAPLAQIDPALLPTGWRLSEPAQSSVTVGNLPQGLAYTPDRSRIAFVESGVGRPAVHVIDAASLADVARLELTGASGRPLWDADGNGLWVGTGERDAIAHISLVAGAAMRVERRLFLPGRQFYPWWIVRDPRGTRLAIAGESAGSVVITDETVRNNRFVIRVGKHPAQLAWSPDGTRIFASLWGERSVAVIDLDRGVVVRKIRVGLHPEGLALTKDGGHVYVANSDDDTIFNIDAQTLSVSATYRLDLFGTALVGLSPSAVSLSGDEKRLYVACSAANAIAVIDLEHGGKLIGAIPTGWYPTDVAVDDARHHLVIVDGKGEGSHANPKYRPYEAVGNPPPRYDHVALDTAGYIGYNLAGSLRVMPIPSDVELATLTKDVQNGAAPYLRAAEQQEDALLHGPPPADAAEAEGQRTILKGGPIHHVFYIVKENRTYDQVLGDVPQGDGDLQLAVFGGDVTPNEHALAQQFGLFDRAFTDGQVSEDGHVWLNAAFANDYLEKTWPPLYGGRRNEQDSDPYESHGGWLWNAAARAGVSYRSYGEWCDADPKHKGFYKTDAPLLKGHIDPRFPSFDMKIADAVRVDEWLREFKNYEVDGKLPSLTWIWLPRDHTVGTQVGMPTPRAMVAENDAAVGRVIEAISLSRYWADSAIFIIEDDSQNGPDHVDEQRTTFFVVSPYARPGLHHQHYTQSGVVRTIELILGLPPMSTYDAGARPLYAAFQGKPDLTPYAAIPAKIDVHEVNRKTAYRAADSNRMDFSQPDRASPALLNKMIQAGSLIKAPRPGSEAANPSKDSIARKVGRRDI